MRQTLHAPHFSYHTPKLSARAFVSSELAISVALVLAIVALLVVKFPVGPDKSGDDGTFIAQFLH